MNLQQTIISGSLALATILAWSAADLFSASSDVTADGWVTIDGTDDIDAARDVSSSGSFTVSWPPIDTAREAFPPSGDITVIRKDGFHGRCPICEGAGTVSVVYQGWCTTTLLNTHAFYDTAGNFHFTDPNTTTCEHRCSAGHTFQVIYSGVEELVMRPDGSRIR